MTVAIGNKDKLYDANLAHIFDLFRQAHPEIRLFELPVHGKRPSQRIKDMSVSYTHLTLPTSDLV